jgi:anti-sigma factor RsiW
LNPKDNRLILSYLLGELKGPDKEKFEERYFTEDELFDQIQAIKHDLIDDYVHDRLSNVQRKQFEQHFRRNPRGWEEVEFSRAVRKTLQSPEARTSPDRYSLRRALVALGMAAGLLFVVGIMISTYTENGNLRQQLGSYEAQKVAAPEARPAPSFVVDRLLLDASALRIFAGRNEASTDTQVFRVSKDAAVVEITLRFPNPDANERYTAVLSDAEGVERASVGHLSPSITNGVGRVTALFPSAYLTQGSYVIRLKINRGETVESFAFSLRAD